MHKEDVEHTGYEDDLVRQTNHGCYYGYLFTINNPVQLISFGHNGTSAQMLELNN